ncbi:MAG TPA: hypothetical protein VF857_10240 [Spirochaetota bacterium]
MIDFVTRIVFIALIASCAGGALWGTETASSPQLSLAIARIKAVNCDEEYGAISEDLLSADVHSAGTFILMDKTQMERVAKKAGFVDFDIGDTRLLADQGKLLKVDKIIVGTIIKHDGFVINLRCIDTKTSTIEYITTEQTRNGSDLGKVMQASADNICRFYSGFGKISGKLDFSTGISSFVPVGAYAKFLNPSYGAILSVNINNLQNEYTRMYFSSGINCFTPKNGRYREFSEIFLTGGISGRFQPVNSMQFCPRASAGPVISRLNYDIDGKRNSKGFTYEKKYYFNFCVLFEAEMSLYIYDRWLLSVAPGFMYIADRKNSGTLFSVGAGIKTLL